MTRKWLFIGLASAAYVVGAVACGQSATTTGSTTDNSTSSSTTSTSSSTTTSTSTSTTSTSTSSSTTTSGGGMGGGTSSGGGAGGMAPCKNPTKLHPPNADAGLSTIFCPFSGVDGGKNDYCDHGVEHCCEPKMGTAACQPAATACAMGDTDWNCEDPSDCGQGMVCCSNTGASIGISPDPNCANFAHKFNGTHCAASCQATEITICTADGECGGGQTCIPFGSKGNQIGGCM